MEFQNKNFSLKIDMKYITIIIFVIAMSVLIATGKIKEPNIEMILSYFIQMVSK